VGKGSTFTVTIATGPLGEVRILDAPPADGMRSPRPKSADALPSLAGARALVVEDGDTNRRLVGLVLQRAGVDVTMAENGRIGADLALQDPFDLILMDMQMPVMDGYTATTLLREHGLTTPIIAMTAHAMKGDQDKCLAAGCSGYVTKPIDADLLVRTLAGMLSGTDLTARRTAPLPPAASPGAAERSAIGGKMGERPEVKAVALEPISIDPAGTPHTSAAGAGDAPSPLPGGPPKGGTLFSALPTEDPDFREIVEEFIQRLQDQVAAMQQALGAQDLGELARLAHWLKGAGGTAGFPAFTQPAKHLETLVEDQQCDEIEAAVAELLELSQRIAVAPAEPALARGVDPAYTE
jgi:CheY-like chemotaxis protein